MEFSIAYFLFLIIFVVASWWITIRWAKMNTRQTTVLMAYTILVILAAELKVQAVLEETAIACAEMIMEKTEEDVQDR